MESNNHNASQPAYNIAIATLGLIKEFQKAQNLRTDMDRMTFEILLFVKSRESARPKALARELNVNPSSITRRMQSLVKEGWLLAAGDQSDGRSSLLRLTESGDSALQAFLDRSAAVIGELLQDWPKDDLRKFEELLPRYVERMANRRIARATMDVNVPKEVDDV
ncbi:MarR family winged helix-turn-helix transcriptional regulator [Paenibacillus xanthanilyticus]|uniref:MarR family winged helix-turn-helix transcriptional regulator n=1 Tax=Paenibacillus xanthanilyticus TaxID=1783531 RepID=A0ABV8K6W3_9BACL